jgi:hypothetical protein
MEIFAFTKANIALIHDTTLESCLSRLEGRPYWLVLDRICYHIYETPEYIVYQNRPVPAELAPAFASYFHVVNVDKPLYSISSYLHADLCSMATSMHLPTGTKPSMYAQIKAKIGLHAEVVKKLIRDKSCIH